MFPAPGADGVVLPGQVQTLIIYYFLSFCHADTSRLLFASYFPYLISWFLCFTCHKQQKSGIFLFIIQQTYCCHILYCCQPCLFQPASLACRKLYPPCSTKYAIWQQAKPAIVHPARAKGVYSIHFYNEQKDWTVMLVLAGWYPANGTAPCRIVGNCIVP